MTNKLLLIIIVAFSLQCEAKNLDSLTSSIKAILDSKDATVGVSIMTGNASDSLSINGDRPLPMQSVFKYHLALAVLSKIDQGELSFSDMVTITQKDLDNKLWSPIRKRYPEGTILTLAEVLKYTVAYSDNVGCDLLFKIIEGPKAVERFLHQSGVTEIAIEFNEFEQQKQWRRQYQNWTTANGANEALRLFYENKQGLLSAKSHEFLWNTMKSSNTGKKLIRGKLPKGTSVAHKTGYSGVNEQGITGARNDIGIVFLPDGRYYYLSVFVSDSSEKSHVNQAIIAEIAKLTWDYFNHSS